MSPLCTSSVSCLKTKPILWTTKDAPTEAFSKKLPLVFCLKNGTSKTFRKCSKKNLPGQWTTYEDLTNALFLEMWFLSHDLQTLELLCWLFMPEDCTFSHQNQHQRSWVKTWKLDCPDHENPRKNHFVFYLLLQGGQHFIFHKCYLQVKIRKYFRIKQIGRAHVWTPVTL